jgi:hypothetical protein
MNLENMTFSNVWLLTICITIATIVLYILLKDNIKLGVKALMTWRADAVNKLHDENGRVKTIFWTFAMFFVGTHILHLAVLWVGILTWTFGIWSPQ